MSKEQSDEANPKILGPPKLAKRAKEGSIKKKRAEGSPTAPAIGLEHS